MPSIALDSLGEELPIDLRRHRSDQQEGEKRHSLCRLKATAPGAISMDKTVSQWTATVSEAELRSFIVKANANTYAGSGAKVAPWRHGAQELEFREGDDGGFYYRDSYFGEKHFLGDEVVYHGGRVIWAMSYHGYLLTEAVTSAAVGRIIQKSLLKTYATGGFLGDFCYSFLEEDGAWAYVDAATGSTGRFVGEERIFRNGVLVYRLNYFGGLIE